MKAFICDACGKYYKPYTIVRPAIVDRALDDYIIKVYDFCPSCNEDFKIFINDFIKNKEIRNDDI